MTYVHHPYIINENGFTQYNNVDVDKMANNRINSLLNRNWFVDENSIVDLLNQATIAEYDTIRSDALSFPDNVRYIIAPEEYNCFPSCKLKCSDMSDSEMNGLTRKQEIRTEAEFEADWKQYSKDIGERSFETIDGDMDDAWDRLQAQKNKLSDHLKKHNLRYIPPSMRANNPVDPIQAAIETAIRTHENEYNAIKLLVESADSIWIDNKKNDYRKTWMPKL